MAKITREEVLKLASLSRLEIKEDEINTLINQLQDVLGYAERVTEIAGNIEIEENKNINVFRKDLVSKTDPEPILQQAPDKQDNLFVVPKILETGSKDII